MSSRKTTPTPTLFQCRLSSLLLILCSVVCAPFSLIVTLHYYLYFNQFYSLDGIRRHFKRQQKIEDDLPAAGTFERKTILITGSRGIKALSLARAFKRLNPYHRVILADSRNWSILSPTRFSSSTTRHYFLPSTNKRPKEYKKSILQLIHSERVDHWIPCSGPSTTLIDSEIAEEVKRELGGSCFCWAPTTKLALNLHEKDKFMALCVQHGMEVPDCSDPLTSVDEAMSFLFREVKSAESHGKKSCRSHKWSYILKPIEFVNGAERTDFTMLPLRTKEETESHLHSKFRSKTPGSWSFNTSQLKPLFILQRFIKGPEYCTQASVYDNELRSFVCCKGSDMVMRYEDVRRLSTDYEVSGLAEEWTRLFLGALKAANSRFDGHFSIDFIYEESEGKLYPIECNPRVHTAVTLFRSVAEDLAFSYLSKGDGVDIVRPSMDEPAHIWLAHSIPLSILNFLPVPMKKWLPLIHPNLTQDYFFSFFDTRFDPISFSPKPNEGPLFLIRSVLFRSNVSPKIIKVHSASMPDRPPSFDLSNSEQLDPLWDIEYHSDDLLIWWVMAHVYWNWLLFYQVFLRNKPWSRVNVSTGRIWEV
ncbi:hypothetical protein CROQUDRAFT_130011 [Cronartium quercuum f. sp. fusiforme G11]|uniref:ATP-grasp domain-containing protein n=1 Tax=Cronartium quercuum f. sp. fusiforme G11 TaxID=708437 RepID=A0A9P6TGN3_9BASI|nr:hypothetical protein CROQUDRAFT_130011 [Cronartium quercuum f. sp. fusiforme G11]